MKPVLRWTALTLALLGAAWLALFADDADVAHSDVAQAAKPSTKPSGAAPTKQAAERSRSTRDHNSEILELRVRAASSENLKALFTATHFAAPRVTPAAPKPAPVPVAAAPAAPAPAPPIAPPTAPPLPFVFVGKHFDGARWEVFVSRGEQTLILRAGQSIDASYKVESVQPPRMVITYLPLDEKQTLNIGNPQ